MKTRITDMAVPCPLLNLGLYKDAQGSPKRHSTPRCFIFSTQIRVSSVPLVHLVLVHLVVVLVHLVLVLLVLVLVHLVVIRRGREKRREQWRSRICRIFLNIVLLQYLVHHSAIFRCLNYYSKFFIYLISVL